MMTVQICLVLAISYYAISQVQSVPRMMDDDSGSIEIPDRPANSPGSDSFFDPVLSCLDVLMNVPKIFSVPFDLFRQAGPRSPETGHQGITAPKVPREKNLFDVIGTMLGLVQKTCVSTIEKAHKQLKQKEQVEEELIDILKTIDNNLQH